MLTKEEFDIVYERVDNAYSTMLVELQELANQYGVKIEGRLSIDNLEQDFNSRMTMERNISISPCKI